MIKLIGILALIFCIGYVAADSFVLVDEGYEWFAMYADKDGDNINVLAFLDFKYKLNKLKAATVMCFHSNHKYKLYKDAPGFLYQVWCGIDKCQYNYQLGAIFMGSKLASTNPVTWQATGGSPNDLSQYNKGVLWTADGDDSNYLYTIPYNKFKYSNFPWKGEPDYLVCYSKFYDKMADVNPLTNIEVDHSWKRENVEVWF